MATTAASPDAPITRAQKTEAKNQVIRDGLAPLGPGDRYPGSLRFSIGLTAIAGFANIIAFLAGLRVSGQKVSVPGVIGFSGLMLIASGGMAYRRYWAVLGFEALLAILVLFFGVLLTAASNLLAVGVCLFFIVGPGYLFFKLVKVMARIQMPERPGARTP